MIEYDQTKDFSLFNTFYVDRCKTPYLNNL